MVLWLRRYIPNAGVGVRSLVRELDPTCCNQELECLNLKKKKKKKILHTVRKILSATTKTQSSQLIN